MNCVSHAIRRIRNFWADRGGMIIPELAFALPILLTLTLGGAELSRYILLNQKLNRSVSTMGDLVSQALNLSEQGVTDLYKSVDHVMVPFELGDKGLIIVSSVGPQSTPPYDPIVLWQRCGGGTKNASSKIGGPGDVVDFSFMKTPFVVPPGENVIVSEIFYDYAPSIIGGVTKPWELYDIVIYTPRIQPLTQIEAGGEASTCTPPA